MINKINEQDGKDHYLKLLKEKDEKNTMLKDKLMDFSKPNPSNKINIKCILFAAGWSKPCTEFTRGPLSKAFLEVNSQPEDLIILRERNKRLMM